MSRGEMTSNAPIALVCAARSSQPIYDFERYYEIATNPGRPYLDFSVEYPPGTVLTLRTLARAAPSRARFGVGLVLISVDVVSDGETAKACSNFVAQPTGVGMTGKQDASIRDVVDQTIGDIDAAILSRDGSDSRRRTACPRFQFCETLLPSGLHSCRQPWSGFPVVLRVLATLHLSESRVDVLSKLDQHYA